MARKRKNNTIKYAVPAVRKAFQILELFASANRGYTISEVSRVLKLPISTTSSLLYTMLHCGYVTRGEKGQFRMTMKLLSEANKALNQIEIREVAQPVLKNLTQITGLASILTIRDGDQLVCIEKIEGASQIRLASTVGKRMHLHHASTGKALLAYLPEEQVEAIAKSAGLPAATPKTITSLQALKKELKKVRAQGYALDDEETGIGIRGVSAPIFDHRGEVVASLAVGGAVFELRDNLKVVVAHVKNAAMEISSRLGYEESAMAAPG